MSPMKLERLLLCLLKFMSTFLKNLCVGCLVCFLTWVKEDKWIKAPIIPSPCRSRLKKVVLIFLMHYLFLEFSELSLNVLF